MKQKVENVLKVPVVVLSAFYVLWTYFFYRNYFIENRFLVSPSSLVNIFSNLKYPHSFSLGRFAASSAYYLVLLVGLGLICTIAFAIGRRILRLLRIEGESLLESTIFALGLGFGSLSLMTFGLGILKLYYTWIIYFILAILGIFSIFELKKVKLEKRQSSSGKPKVTVFTIFLCGTLVVSAVINLAGALAPGVFYDALVFHLAVPTLYKISHGIRYIETIFTSHFPQNMHMLYTLSLLLGTDILAKLIHWIMGIFVVLLIYAFGRKYFNYRTGLLAAATLYTVPMVAMQSRVTGVDLGLTFFELLAVFSLVNWFSAMRREEKPRPVKDGWLVASAIFSGLAMGVKYTAMYSFLLFAISVFLGTLIVNRQKIRVSLKKTFLFCVVATALFSPWMTKNTIYTNNPFNPFLSNVFKSKNLYFDSDYTPLDTEVYLNKGARKWSRFPTRNVKEWLVFPWTLTKGGNDSNSFVGPIFLYLLPLLFFLRKDNLAKFLIFLGIAWFFAWSLIAVRNLRFFISGLTLFGIIISYLLLGVEKKNKYFTKVLVFLVFLMLANNVAWSLIILTANKDPWGVVLGTESREEYLSRDSIGWNLMPYYYPVVKYINENLPTDAKVLFIGEARGYYCERDFVTSLAEDPHSIVSRLVRFCRDRDELLEKLKSLGITHVLYNRREAYRLRNYKIFDWQGDDFSIFHKFWRNNLKLLYTEKDVYLFEVRYEKGKDRINYVEIYGSPEVDGYIMEARRLIFRNKFDQAIKLLEQASRIAPDSAVTHFNLGLAYMNKRNVRKAIEECNLSLAFNPYDPETYLLLGYLYFQEKNFGAAKENFKRVIGLNPNSAEGHGYLGFVYAEMGEHEAAIEELRRAVDLAPDNKNFRKGLRNLEQRRAIEKRRR